MITNSSLGIRCGIDFRDVTFVRPQFGLHTNQIEMINFEMLIYNPFKCKTNPSEKKNLRESDEQTKP